jgi:hypothetical protein
MGWLWHRRLGHIGMKQLNKLIKYDLVRGLKDVTFEKDKLCSACQAEKQVGNTQPKKRMMSTSKPFELFHMDLFGPTTYTSIVGNKYEFVIVDDFTREKSLLRPPTMGGGLLNPLNYEMIYSTA